MQRIRSVLSVALFALAIFHHAHAQDVASMRLLTSQTGWAASDRQLFWTTDTGQHWKDISPKRSDSDVIASVFFLDASKGWVLIAFGEANANPQFKLAATSDAGATWSIRPVNIQHWNSGSSTLDARGDVNFIDPMHGWMNLGLVSGANFRLGILLMTKDGGETWDWVPESPGVSGLIRFLSLKEGWLAGGPDGSLYATHDGFKSWQKISLKAPPQALPALYPTYDLPTFEGEGRGFLPVTYSGPDDANSSLVLFATNDWGKTWSVDRVLAGLKETSIGQREPSAIVGEALIAPISSDSHLVIATMIAGESTRKQTSGGFASDFGVGAMSFATSSYGWVLAFNGKLLATHNGGVNWTDVTPTHDQKIKSSLIGVPSGLKIPGSSVTGVSIHLGFDTGCTLSPSQMRGNPARSMM